MRISFILGLVVGLSFVFGLHQTKSANGQIMKELGLKSGELITIEQPSKSELGITMNGQNYMVDYDFFSNRSENFRLMVPSETGELVEVEAPPVRTIRGTLRGLKGSSVVGSVTDEGCCARIMFPSGEDCWIEPVSRTLDNPAFAGIHVVYTSRDVIEAERKVCGNVENLVAPAAPAPVANAQQRDRSVVDSNILGGSGTVSSVRIAMEADFEYFSEFGSRSDTCDQLEMLMNLVNSQYDREADITHEITVMIIRDRINDPWTFSFGPSLIDQLRTWYRPGGQGFGTITGNLCYLFTGRENLTGIDNSGNTINIAGIAGVGTLCTSGGAFGVVQFDERVQDATNILAHELGHNWGLLHCDDYDQNCPEHTMHFRNNGANNFHNSIIVPRLIAFRDSLSCVSTRTFFGLTGTTTNDDWANRTPIAVPDFSETARSFGFTTEAGEQNLTSVGSTGWWSLSSDSSGTMVIDTFGSDYDTQLHVYSFVPGADITSLVLVDNNDDSNGTLQSEVTFDVTAGTSYAIRVGGFRSSFSPGVGGQGNIDLNGEFTRSLLRGDVNLSGDVSFIDIPAFIAVLQSGIFQEEADANEDGRVDFLDIPSFIQILQGI